MDALAYLLTFSTYGAKVSGQEGCVDRNHNAFGARLPAPNPAKVRYVQARMRAEPYLLNEERRSVVLEAIRSVCKHRQWELFAAHVRTNHVHVVLCGDVSPEIMVDTFKAFCSRALNISEGRPYRRWTRHASTRYLWNSKSVQAAVEYVVAGQGEPLAVFRQPTIAC